MLRRRIITYKPQQQNGKQPQANNLRRLRLSSYLQLNDALGATLNGLYNAKQILLLSEV